VVVTDRVHDREVCRMVPFVRGLQPGADLSRGSGSVRDVRAPLVGVRLRRHAFQRHVHEVGVGQVLVPIGVGSPPRLGQEVNHVGRVPLHRRQIPALEDVGHLGHRGAAGRRRRHRQHPISPVRKLDGVTPGCSVSLEILVGDDPASTLHLGYDEVGGLAPIEPVRAVVPNPPECRGQPRQRKRLAHLGHVPVGQERGCRGREPCQAVARAQQVAAETLVDHEALGQPDRRLHQVRPRQGAEALVGLPQPHHRAGDAGSEMPHHGLVGKVARLIEEHVPGRRAGSLLPVVQCGGRPVRHPHHHEPTTADVSGFGIHDGQGQGDRDGCVYSVTAGPHDVYAYLAGIHVRADHHATLGRDGRGVRGIPPRRVE